MTALKEVQNDNFANSSHFGAYSPTIYVNNVGAVVIQPAGGYAWAPDEHQFRAWLERRDRAVEYVADIRAEANHFSRDEKAMFELLSPWQQWSFLVMRRKDRVNV